MQTKTSKTIEINHMEEEEDKDDKACQGKKSKSKNKSTTKKIAVPNKTLKKNPETHDTMSQELPSSIPAHPHPTPQSGLTRIIHGGHEAKYNGRGIIRDGGRW